ncbi:hypothetical protein LXL04_020269 [Taraxacum kok-saghyz]
MLMRYGLLLLIWEHYWKDDMWFLFPGQNQGCIWWSITVMDQNVNYLMSKGQFDHQELCMKDKLFFAKYVIKFCYRVQKCKLWRMDQSCKVYCGLELYRVLVFGIRMVKMLLLFFWGWTGMDTLFQIQGQNGLFQYPEDQPWPILWVLLCNGLLWYHANICCTFGQYFWWWSKKELKSELWKAWLNSNSIPIKRRLIQIWGYWWNFLFRLQLPIVCKRYGLVVKDFWTKSWIFQLLYGHKRYIKTWFSVGFFGLLQTRWKWYLMLSLLRWVGGQIGIQFRRKRYG